MSKPRPLLGSLAAGTLVASLALPAFAQSDAPIPIEGAEGMTWQLVEQSIDGTMTPVPDGVLVTLLLQDGQAGGTGGCNSYSAPYTIGTSSLTFGPVISTFMFCEGPGGEVETAYFADLAAVATWANTGGSLVLGDAQGEPILTFLPAPEAPADGIEGVTWLLTAQLVEGALAPLPSGPDGGPVLVSLLLQDGRSGGTGGCNSYFARLHPRRLRPDLRAHRLDPDVLRGGRQRGRGGLLREPRQRGQLGVGWHHAQPRRRVGQPRSSSTRWPRRPASSGAGWPAASTTAGVAWRPRPVDAAGHGGLRR